MKISAILLGAGESKRMGRDKLSLPWGKKTMLEHCLQTLLYSRVEEVIVVVNERTEKIVCHRNEKRVKVVLNPYYRRGMSSSIHCGIQHLNPKSAGILIALGDQPLLKTQTINALLEAFEREEGKIILPSFRRRRGHPVIFHRTFKEELLRLRGDAGGKSILMRHPGEVCIIPVRSEGVIRDIDIWEDYKRGGVRSCNHIFHKTR